MEKKTRSSGFVLYPVFGLYILSLFSALACTVQLLIVFLPVSPERVNRGAGFMEAGKESVRPKVFNLIGHRSFFVPSEKALS